MPSTPLATSPRAPAAALPGSLARYRIVRELGRGAQGRVCLAHDPHLDRHVAIKILLPGRDPAAGDRLLAEARTVAQLRHANIVALHDAFEDAGANCMVMEFVEGRTLERMLREDGALSPGRAVEIAVQIADALAYAHARRIVHRDIKPGNVMIDAEGTARITDFGLATEAGTEAGDSPSGTPLYMAPEVIANGSIGTEVDVFAAGMVLYEMLTGRTAAQGRTVYEVMHRIANLPFAPPSSLVQGLDEALDQIVLRALSKDPAVRYPDAAAMRQALEAYRRPAPAEAPTPASEGGSGVLDFLLKRIQNSPGFPALSQTIGSINRLTAGDAHGVQALTDVLLKDFALTNRLLRTVNSSGFRQFGGGVSTISRAVMILGFDSVRSLAITLVLVEHLQNRAQAARFRDDLAATLFNGVLARRLARGVGVREPEEGFVCGLFQTLGRLLAGYYLYEESVEVDRRIQQGGLDEESASRAVVGISYRELGTAVAKNWNLPAKVVESIRRIREDRPAKPVNADQRLQLVGNLAAEIGAAVGSTPGAQRSERIAALARRYHDALGLGEKELGALVDAAVDEFVADAAQFVGDTRKSRFCQALRQSPASDGADGGVPGSASMEGIETPATCLGIEDDDAAKPDAAAVLAAGIQDITNTLVGDYSLSDVLRIILETMYRGLGFDRIMLLMRNGAAPTLQARFGYGPGIEGLVGKLSMPFGGDQDVFSLALRKNIDVLISDVNADNIRARIPDWHRQQVGAETFVLLPIVLEKRVIGLFYGDRARAGELAIGPREMNLLKTLRNQAVLALRQRR